MLVFEQIRRCRYCNSEMTDIVSAIGYAQNPFCHGCLDERIKNAPRAPENEVVVQIGRYFHFIPVVQTGNAGA